MLPSNIGGAHWGGVAVDPERSMAVVPVNRLASVLQLFPREGFELAARPGDARQEGALEAGEKAAKLRFHHRSVDELEEAYPIVGTT